jgi:ATP-dependent helicase/nuclease subunit A
MNTQPRLDFDAPDAAAAPAAIDPLEARDARARLLAVDPTRNIALEASAGTGKTRVLVDRYVGLLLAGIKPRNILAITFTRKAAAEMRQRILQELTRRHDEKTVSDELWREIRDSLTDITISTIDAFCLALLREFPLEADVDPGFELADETETPRLVEEALERTLRIGRGIAVNDADMSLLFAELGEYRLREGLGRLIDRRLVAWTALNRFLGASREITVDDAVHSLLVRLRAAFSSIAGGAAALIASGPDDPAFGLFARDLRQLLAEPPPTPPVVQALLERVREHLLTQEGQPRKRLLYKKADFKSPADYERHCAAIAAIGPYLVDAERTYRHDINIVLARAVRQLFAIARDQYARTLSKHGVLDFTDVLQRTLELLGRMEEFSRSRFKLESRYQHVLVDEFQDTSRAQWELVELLVRSWSEGFGLSDRDLHPSIFIVGDRKQSIYAFRDAEVAVLDEAARYIEALRPIGQVRTAITRSFRSVRELLTFINDLFFAINKAPDRPDAFRYSDDDEFPVASIEATGTEALGLVAARSDVEQAASVADEIAMLLAPGATVRDRDTGLRRAAAAGDIAILFRTRETHRLFEEALARRRVPFYVYKGLGFFDADEIKDILALIGFLALPQSELRAAAFLRSRFVRLTDEALKHLAPRLAAAVAGVEPPGAWAQLQPYDQQRLNLARAAVPRWLALVDRLPPSELIDRVLADSAYAVEIGGPSYRQARENLKKIRGLIRRIQNRGYTTLARISDHFAQLVAGGDESNAIVDAADAVNLMTVHAAKGLEFPIVFVVNMARGGGGSPDAIRISPSPFGGDHLEPSVSIGEHESAADKDAEAKEAEESKRLLYVALTRARDRLYLATTLLPDGRFVPLKGGLGRILPAEVATLFAAATTVGDERVVSWNGPSGSHRFRVLTAAEAAVTLPPMSESLRSTADDFAPVAAGGVRRTTVTALVASSALATVPGQAPSSIEAGVLVHRALQAGIFSPDGSTVRTRDLLARYLKDDERAMLDDPDALIEGAAAALEALRRHPELVEADARDPRVVALHEVPFSLRRPDTSIVRGTIDLLIQRASGTVEVIEFKTGRPLLEHSEQLALYVEAARVLYPNVRVEGRVLYAFSPAPTALS